MDSDKPNAYGLHHMIGNVWEWCSDWYRDDTCKTQAAEGKLALILQGPGDSNDPNEPGLPKRVNRGGSFLCDASYCASYRPAARMKTSPDTGMIHSGFRAAMSDAEWRAQLVKQKYTDSEKSLLSFARPPCGSSLRDFSTPHAILCTCFLDRLFRKKRTLF